MSIAEKWGSIADQQTEFGTEFIITMSVFLSTGRIDRQNRRAYARRSCANF